MTQKQESPFDKEFLDKMKTKLLEMKAELEKKLNKHGSINPEDPTDYEADYVDLGDEEDDNVHEIENYEVDKNLEESWEKELRDVESALKRIEDGVYGICKYTGKPIDKKRLEARPTSSASIEAKQFLQNT